MVIAPRHREKFDFFAEKVSALGLPWVRWSDTNRTPREDASIILLDTFGELNNVYSFSAAAFVGATLVPIGGHNPLEPAAYGVPVAMGPHYFVVRDVVDAMRSADAITIIESPQAVVEFIASMRQRSSLLQEQGARGRDIGSLQQGAVARVQCALESVAFIPHSKDVGIPPEVRTRAGG